ncbi:MAG: hypothetical protein ABI690_23205 [Chloroflexota bacterium]
MVRKRDRVIATLIVWIGVLVAMSVILGRLSGAALDMQNFWYYSGNVVTGGSSEEALQALNSINGMMNQLQFQTQQFAQAEMFAYLPYVVLLSAIFLGGGLLSTLFIWRSVAVPAELAERVKDYKEFVPPPRTVVHLDDDGELIHMATHSQSTQNYQEES